MKKKLTILSTIFILTCAGGGAIKAQSVDVNSVCSYPGVSAQDVIDNFDSNGDGILDNSHPSGDGSICPATGDPETELQAAEEYCNADYDGNGTIGCPPAEACPNDQDCDGVLDPNDKCPNSDPSTIVSDPSDPDYNCGCPTGDPNGCGNNNPDNCDNCKGVPVGGGLFLLLGGAAAYATMMFVRTKKKENDNAA